MLRTVFWTSCSFLTKVANFEQKDSCAECFDAKFEQQDKCAKGFKEVLAINVQTLCGNVVVLEIGDFCLKAKTCSKPVAQRFICWKLASKHPAQLSFRSRLAKRQLRRVF